MARARRHPPGDLTTAGNCQSPALGRPHQQRRQPMRTLDYLLLAVRDPQKSAELYTSLLGREPAAKSPTFVLYVLPTGLKIGLWLATEVEPKPLPAGGI